MREGYRLQFSVQLEASLETRTLVMFVFFFRKLKKIQIQKVQCKRKRKYNTRETKGNHTAGDPQSAATVYCS